jgi:hypothetical protein
VGINVDTELPVKKHRNKCRLKEILIQWKHVWQTS